jgi:hypothetical protein
VDPNKSRANSFSTTSNTDRLAKGDAMSTLTETPPAFAAAMEDSYPYIIVGAGLAGAAAVEGIRERDQRGSVLLLGPEKDLPYDRPPLSKQLWTGGTIVEEIVLHDGAFY